MVKKERIVEQIKRKNMLKQQCLDDIKNTEKSLSGLKNRLEEIDLEISLLEDHIKKMDG